MQLRQMRDEFWDTAPHYGGQKEIWDALRAAAEADMSLAQAIVDSAGVIVTSADMSTCYDERGTYGAFNAHGIDPKLASMCRLAPELTSGTKSPLDLLQGLDLHPSSTASLRIDSNIIPRLFKVFLAMQT
ncbi:hypothetical protein AMTR_s00130p00065830 [Amborella trichopoda]|uniref:DC-UbP/UBTD2 N-terminal domain-containing protein n=1 Tax=Amborella trichopoda TaxID=13333 RepID=W1NPE2_AMBTC|nr:hypothetical protein AMTR_s00130p00065830 [Amborella trichopoda]